MLRLLLSKPPSKSPPLFIKHLTTTSSPSPSSSLIDPSSSLTLHFLKTSCRLSPETALSACKKVHLKSTKSPHQVLSLLKSYHFTDPDISKLVARRPKLLLADPVKTLKPKFDFFQSIGFAGPALVALVVSVPTLLQFSLPNKLQHNFDLLKRLLRSEANAVSAIRGSTRLLVSDLDKILLPEIKVLEDFGAPLDVILKLIVMHCKSLAATPSRFKETLEIVKRLGINPKSTIFAHAFGMLAKLPDKEWARKVETFKMLGWSEEQVLLAFSRHPYCMSVSREKVVRNMEFYREKFGWDPSYMSKNSVVLSFSFERRVLPRFRVFRLLESKGLFSGRVGVRQMMMGERHFLEKYVLKFSDQVPEVIDEGLRCKLEDLGLVVNGKEDNAASDAMDS